MRRIILVLMFIAIAMPAFAARGSSDNMPDLANEIAVYDTKPSSCNSLLPISATAKDRDRAFLKLLHKVERYGGNAMTKYRERYDGSGYRMEATALLCGK